MSQQPTHVDGVQPFTRASTHVTRPPGPSAVESTGRLIVRSSPPQPAHTARWFASEISILNVKSQLFSVLLSCVAVV